MIDRDSKTSAGSSRDAQRPAGRAASSRRRAAVAPPIERRADRATHPLSFGQQRLWFMHQLNAADAAFNVHTAVRGRIERPALERSLAEVVRRHEVLRTTIAVIDGEPRQRVSPPIPVPVRFVDFSGLPEDGRERTAVEFAAEEEHKPFDLERGPLVRVVLLHLAPEDQVLLLTMHHIVCDAWSMAILTRELGELYVRDLRGEALQLPELPVQYGDFAAHQRRWLQGEVLGEHQSYWRQQLAGFGTLALPTDRPRPAVPSGRGRTIPFRLPASLTNQLKRLSREQGATLFMTLMAAFKVLLSRYSGQHDIVIGTDIGTRKWKETEGVIGFFVNQLVLRTGLDGNPTFAELLRRVQRVTVGAYAHQDFPFEKLVEELAPDRDQSRTPLFQVKFVLGNSPDEKLRVAGLRVGSLNPFPEVAKLDLTLVTYEQGGQLRGHLEYATDLFDGATMERLLGHWQAVLASVAADPEQRMGDLSLLTAGEREQIAGVWSVGPERPAGEDVLARFAAQVAARPEAVAVVWGDEHVSYQTLAARAAQVGRYLSEVGVGPEVAVALCVERSPQWVVSLLGILQAGGAFVPVDPRYPPERVAFMLGDVGAPVGLTEAGGRAALPAGGWTQWVSVDEEWDAIAASAAPARHAAARPEQLAYVIYTSGSTGQPKGVAVSHAGLRNLAAAQTELLGVAAGTRVWQFAAASFDAAVWDWVLTLLAGGTLVIGQSEDERVPGPACERWLAARGVELMTVPPSALAQLRPEALPGVTTVVLAGEAAGAALTAQWAPGRRVFNAYGPTETTVCATMSGVLPGTGVPPVGRPLPNLTSYVLSPELTLVPTGVSGELYVGGVGVARGYWQQAALTAERFVPDGVSGAEGGRLYRTGDRVRWLASGELEYLGRRDTQVKVRGYRIEVGEIEAALQGQAGVRQAVVVAGAGPAGDTQLTAYVVPEPGQRLSEHELTRGLQVTLPPYMTALLYAFVDALPLTPSGKVDRQALADLQPVPAAREQPIRLRTEAEELVAQIWEEVLGVEEIDCSDNFFDRGGHSLLATQALARTQEVFRTELSVRTLFDAPTIDGVIAALVRIHGSRDTVEEIARTYQELAHLSRGGVSPLSAATTGSPS